MKSIRTRSLSVRSSSFKHVLPIIGMLSWGTASLQAQEVTQPHMNWSWTKEPWTDDDEPYLLERKKIDQLADKNQLTDVVIDQYKAKISTAERYTNPLAIFRWSYAAYRLQISKHTPGQERLKNTLESLLLVQDKDGTPHLSYNYCRLVYLCYMMNGLSMSPLKKVGERLLETKGNDYEVKFFQVQFLDDQNPTDREIKSRYLSDLKRQNPHDIGLQNLIASEMTKKWILTRDKKFGDLSILEHGKLLKMKGITPQMRESVNRMINIVKADMNRH